jgi:hypothetical protein
MSNFEMNIQTHFNKNLLFEEEKYKFKGVNYLFLILFKFHLFLLRMLKNEQLRSDYVNEN